MLAGRNLKLPDIQATPHHARVGALVDALNIAKIPGVGLAARLAKFDSVVRCAQAFVRISKAQGVFGASPERYRLIVRAFRTFIRAWRLHESGREKATVIRRLCANRSIRMWLYRGTLPNIITKADPKARAKTSSDFDIPLGQSPAFSYILGAVCAAIRPRFRDKPIKIQSARTGEVPVIRDLLLSACNFRPRKKDGSSTWLCLGRPLSAYFSDVTANGTKLPWRHLTTSGERLAFLKGFLRYLGIAVRPGYTIVIQRRSNPSMLRHLGLALLKEGIWAKMSFGQFGGTLTVSNRHHVERLVKLGAVVSDVPASGCNSEPQRIVRAYSMALELARDGVISRVISEKIFDKLGFKLGISTVNFWRHGRAPCEVLQLRELEKLNDDLRTELFNVEVAGAIVKNWAVQKASVTDAFAHLVDFYGKSPFAPSWTNETDKLNSSAKVQIIREFLSQCGASHLINAFSYWRRFMVESDTVVG